MTQVANTVITEPAYISNDTPSVNITVTDPISGAKTVTFATGYYEFQFNDGTGDGTEASPWHILKKLAAATTTNWTYEMGTDGRLIIGYLGTGTATFVFADSHVKNLFGSTSSTLTFTGAGTQTMTYPVFGMFISKSRKGDGQWKHTPGFSIYQETTDSRVIGWNDGNHKQTRKFSFDFLPRDQNFKDAGMVSTPAYPVSASAWNTTPSALSYTAPYTALRFLKSTQGKLLKLYLGPLPYNGTDEYFKVYFRPDSIKKANRFTPSINGNEKYVTMDEVEVLLSDADSGEASYATGALVTTFSPTQISNLYMWLRSDDLVQAFGTVSQVNDKSGNGKHAVQAISGSQPYYFAAGGLNNLPYWQGTSANSAGRYLLAGANGDFDFLHNGTDWTIIYVASTPASTGKLILGTQGDYSSDRGFAVWEYSSPGVTYYMGNGSSAIISKTQTTGFTVNQYQKTIIRYDDDTTPNFSGSSETNSTIFTANKIGSTSATTSGRKFGVGCAGSGQFSTDAKFHEVIVYNKKLSDSEVVSIQEYLTTRYGFNPANVPGLQAWWTAEDVALSGGKITQFNDKSGYARNATNANATYQVTQSVDAAYNSKNIAVANGNALQAYAPTSFTIAQPLTIFAVGDVNGTLGVDYETFIDSANVGTRIIMRTDPSFNFIVYAGWANINLTSTVNSKTTPSIAWCEYNGASSKGNVNSTTATALSSPGASSLTQPQLFVGNAGSYMMKNGGKFAALLIYNRVLTTEERTSILTYLSNYYGITLT